MKYLVIMAMILQLWCPLTCRKCACGLHCRSNECKVPSYPAKWWSKEGAKCYYKLDRIYSNILYLNRIGYHFVFCNEAFFIVEKDLEYTHQLNKQKH